MSTLEDLAVRGFAGDQAAFAELYRLVTPKMTAAAYSVTGNVALGDDLVAAAWEQMWLRRGTYTPMDGRFVGWARTIVRNLAFSRRQRLVVQKEVSFGELIHLPSAERAQSAEDIVLAEMERAEVVSSVREAVAVLPASEAIVAQMHGLEGRTTVELAAMLPLSRAGVKAANGRARRRLRESLGHLRGAA